MPRTSPRSCAPSIRPDLSDRGCPRAKSAEIIRQRLESTSNRVRLCLVPAVGTRSSQRFSAGVRRMSEGTIKRLTDKGFGFIANGTGTDMFFHMSAVEGVRFEDLREGQKVSYNEGRGPKGPRAENVRVI
ncbi:MAG TPA: cold-shock protein [Kofleriaceae bacterium]|nr:cold-shock protein [Kofleriaceae bacterium]